MTLGRFYSSETALLLIHDDIPASFDACQSSALLFLISAASDTKDQCILIRLLNWFIIKFSALWLHSPFLSERFRLL